VEDVEAKGSLVVVLSLSRLRFHLQDDFLADSGDKSNACVVWSEGNSLDSNRPFKVELSNYLAWLHSPRLVIFELVLSLHDCEEVLSLALISGLFNSPNSGHIASKLRGALFHRVTTDCLTELLDLVLR
jgi:hypothetical protein